MKTMIKTQIEKAKDRLQAAREHADREYKEEVTKAVHDFLDQNRAYYPEGLLVSGGDDFNYRTVKLYNNDGVRAKRTYVSELPPRRRDVHKLSEDTVKTLTHVGKIFGHLSERIANFEGVAGGPMFEYHRLHFRGTHTLHDLGLDVVPQYVIDEMIKFGWYPQHFYELGFDYDEIKKTWDYDLFSQQSAASGYDVFLCMEDGHYYYPSEGKLSDIYIEALPKNIASWMREYNEKAA